MILHSNTEYMQDRSIVRGPQRAYLLQECQDYSDAQTAKHAAIGLTVEANSFPFMFYHQTATIWSVG